MAFLEQLTPQQKKLALYGAGAVALIVVARRILTPAAPAPAADPDPAPASGSGDPANGAAYPDQAVLGVDALSQWQSAFADYFSQIMARLVTLNNNAPLTPTKNLSAESRQRIWMYLSWLYGDATPPAGTASPFNADQLLAELYKRKVPKQNKHLQTMPKAGAAYYRFVVARETAGGGPRTATDAVGPTSPEQQAPPPPAPRPRRNEPAPGRSSSPGSAGRPAPVVTPVTTTPDALVIGPAQVNAGPAAYGTTRPAPRPGRGPTLPARGASAPGRRGMDG